MTLHEIEQQPCGGNVGLVCDLLDNTTIIEARFRAIVEIFGVVPDIEYAVLLYAVRLVYLKVETNRFHTEESVYYTA
jgi:hypothetical protein